MEDSPVTYLESVKIEKLWGEVDIEWNLDPKVNILVGRNGTGKTTILNLIEAIVNHLVQEFIEELTYFEVKTDSISSYDTFGLLSQKFYIDLVYLKFNNNRYIRISEVSEVDKNNNIFKVKLEGNKLETINFEK